MKTLPAAILAALILSGCSSATLQFASDPEGAVVRTSGNGSVLGTTPFSVSVDPDSLARYATSPGCYTATTLSGSPEPRSQPHRLSICVR